MDHQTNGTQMFLSILRKAAEALFREDVENIAGANKTGRQNKPTRYTFSREIVRGVTPSIFALRLAENGFPQKFSLSVVLHRNDGVLCFEGNGFPHEIPRMVFSDDMACLTVPYSLEDRRNWDVIVREMVSLFYQSDHAQ